MPTSFVTLQTAAKLNPDSRPPYVVEIPPHLTTTYGGIFIPWNSFAFTGHEKSPVFEPGIYASACGARLLAPTWANRPVQQGIFLGDSDMIQATSRGQFWLLSHESELSSIEKPMYSQKVWGCVLSPMRYFPYTEGSLFCSRFFAGTGHAGHERLSTECKHFITFYFGCLTFRKNGV